MKALERNCPFMADSDYAERKLREHRERLKSMKKSIDNSLPYGCGGSGSRHNTSPNKSHILKKAAKDHVNRENYLLAKRLYDIMEGQSALSERINDTSHLDNHPGTMNFKQRLREAKRIHEKNMILAARLDSIQPYYKVSDLSVVKYRINSPSRQKARKTRFMRELEYSLQIANRLPLTEDIQHLHEIQHGIGYYQDVKFTDFYKERIDSSHHGKGSSSSPRPRNLILEYTKVQDDHVLDIAVVKEPFHDRYIIFGMDVENGQRYELRLTSEDVSNIVDGDILVTSVDNVEVWMIVLNKVELEPVENFEHLDGDTEDFLEASDFTQGSPNKVIATPPALVPCPPETSSRPTTSNQRQRVRPSSRPVQEKTASQDSSVVLKAFDLEVNPNNAVKEATEPKQNPPIKAKPNVRLIVDETIEQKKDSKWQPPSLTPKPPARKQPAVSAGARKDPAEPGAASGHWPMKQPVQAAEDTQIPAKPSASVAQNPAKPSAPITQHPAKPSAPITQHPAKPSAPPVLKGNRAPRPNPAAAKPAAHAVAKKPVAPPLKPNAPAAPAGKPNPTAQVNSARRNVTKEIEKKNPTAQEPAATPKVEVGPSEGDVSVSAATSADPHSHSTHSAAAAAVLGEVPSIAPAALPSRSSSLSLATPKGDGASSAAAMVASVSSEAYRSASSHVIKEAVSMASNISALSQLDGISAMPLRDFAYSLDTIETNEAHEALDSLSQQVHYIDLDLLHQQASNIINSTITSVVQVLSRPSTHNPQLGDERKASAPPRQIQMEISLAGNPQMVDEREVETETEPAYEFEEYEDTAAPAEGSVDVKDIHHEVISKIAGQDDNSVDAIIKAVLADDDDEDDPVEDEKAGNTASGLNEREEEPLYEFEEEMVEEDKDKQQEDKAETDGNIQEVEGLDQGYKQSRDDNTSSRVAIVEVDGETNGILEGNSEEKASEEKVENITRTRSSIDSKSSLHPSNDHQYEPTTHAMYIEPEPESPTKLDDEENAYLEASFEETSHEIMQELPPSPKQHNETPNDSPKLAIAVSEEGHPNGGMQSSPLVHENDNIEDYMFDDHEHVVEDAVGEEDEEDRNRYEDL